MKKIITAMLLAILPITGAYAINYACPNAAALVGQNGQLNTFVKFNGTGYELITSNMPAGADLTNYVTLTFMAQYAPYGAGNAMYCQIDIFPAGHREKGYVLQYHSTNDFLNSDQLHFVLNKDNNNDIWSDGAGQFGSNVPTCLPNTGGCPLSN